MTEHALPKDQRRGRLEGLVTLPRLIAMFGCVVAFLIILFFAATSTDPRLRLGITLLGFIAVAMGWQTLRSGSIASLALHILTGLPLLLAFAPLRRAVGNGEALAGAVEIFTLVGGAVVLLAGVRLLAPFRAALLGMSTAVAISLTLFVINLLDDQSRPPDPAQISRSQRVAAIDPKILFPPTVLLAGSPGMTHPTIEYLYRPSSVFKHYFPDDPRGYFSKESIYGAIDARLARLHTGPDVTADGYLPGEASGVLRIEPKTIHEDKVWSVGWQFNQVPYLKDWHYNVSFSARADQPRPINVHTNSPADDFANTGLFRKLELPQDWGDFQFTFVANRNVTDGLLNFDMGHAAIPVELRNIRLWASPPEDLGRIPSNSWRLVNPGAADQQPSPFGLDTVQVLPSDVSPGTRLVCDLPPLRADVDYVLYLRGRCDTPTDLRVTIFDESADQAHFSREIHVPLEGHFFAEQFTSRAEADRPRLEIDLSGIEAPLEIAEIRLLPRLGNGREQLPQRHAVTYAQNAEGFRDRDHSLTPEPGTIRIACLGDSYTFGQGVHEEDCFVRKLEGLLSLPGQRPQVDVMNFGVWGYCTRQERICYEMFAEKYQPNVVLVTMVMNDNLSFNEEKAHGIGPRPTGSNVNALVHRYTSGSYADVGYEVCLQELMTLHAACARNNAKLAVVLFSAGESRDWAELDRTITSGLAGTEIPLLNLKSVLDQIPHEARIVHELDHHPNEIAHDIAAREIVRFLKRERLVP